MKASYYAKALREIETSGKIPEAKLVDHFLGILTQNGHAHMLPKILRSYQRIRSKEETQSTIEVTSAESLSEHDVQALLKKAPFSNVLTASHKKVIRKTDPTLVGGVVVRSGTTRYDASYKRMLLELYQSLISS